MKKIKITVIILSLLVFAYFFLTNLIVSISYFKNPMEFTFTPLVYTAASFGIIVMHLAAYVFVMDEKRKVAVITDDDNWWEKWDRA